MNLVGDYDWQNTTKVMYSDNVAACKRTSLFILQGKISLDKLKADIKNRVPPDYDAIAEMIIPRFMSTEVRVEVNNTINNVTIIEQESEIRNMKDFNTSVYQYIYAAGKLQIMHIKSATIHSYYSITDFNHYWGCISIDWKDRTYDANATRYLFWHCGAHLILNRRYKDVDFGPVSCKTQLVVFLCAHVNLLTFVDTVIFI
jgi:hypothetical protein